MKEKKKKLSSFLAERKLFWFISLSLLFLIVLRLIVYSVMMFRKKDEIKKMLEKICGHAIRGKRPFQSLNEMTQLNVLRLNTFSFFLFSVNETSWAFDAMNKTIFPLFALHWVKRKCFLFFLFIQFYERSSTTHRNIYNNTAIYKSFFFLFCQQSYCIKNAVYLTTIRIFSFHHKQI